MKPGDILKSDKIDLSESSRKEIVDAFNSGLNSINKALQERFSYSRFYLLGSKCPYCGKTYSRESGVRRRMMNCFKQPITPELKSDSFLVLLLERIKSKTFYHTHVIYAKEETQGYTDSCMKYGETIQSNGSKVSREFVSLTKLNMYNSKITTP